VTEKGGGKKAKRKEGGKGGRGGSIRSGRRLVLIRAICILEVGIGRRPYSWQGGGKGEEKERGGRGKKPPFVRVRIRCLEKGRFFWRDKCEHIRRGKGERGEKKRRREG